MDLSLRVVCGNVPRMKFRHYLTRLSYLATPGTQVYFELDMDANRLALQAVNTGLQKNTWQYANLPIHFQNRNVRGTFSGLTGAIRILNM